MKRLFFFISVVTLFLGFTGCSKLNTQNGGRPVNTLTLALRGGTYADVIKRCLPDFERKYNVRCTTLDMSEDDLHRAVIHTSEEDVSLYDFVMVDSSWMAECTGKGVLADLKQYGYDLDDDIIEATKQICYDDEKLYLAPYYGNVTVLLYNNIMIKEAGYDASSLQSLEDILEVCRFSKKRHNFGFMYRGDTENNIVVDFLPILLSCGGWVVDQNNKPTVDTYEFRRAMDIYLELIDTGRNAPKDDVIAAIANKSGAMCIGWPGWYTPTRNSSMDYVAITGKYEKDGETHNANIYGIWAIGVPKKSNNKEQAVKLLEYLMDPDVQRKSIARGGVPCRYSSLKNEEVLEKFPEYKVVCQALEGGVYRPVLQQWKDFYTILGRKMKMIFDGEKTISDGLREAQTELERRIVQ